MTSTITRDEILAWLRQDEPRERERLWALADQTRARHVGDAVHLRGLIELSNHCVRSCGYCGIRAARTGLERYRLAGPEILACARTAAALGYGTVVLQAGEDPGLRVAEVSAAVRAIKQELGLAVTLSLGERRDDELAAWRAAGADRYLLRFETSDGALFRRIHPDLGTRPSDRIAMLRRLRALGYEIGTGVMVGIPGQSYGSLADDLLLFAELDADMIGVGPFLPHPETPLGQGQWVAPLPPGEQVPNSEELVYRTVALARLVCPEANIPSTTALATLNQAQGRELGLSRGANVVMPNVTPPRFRERYEIYPGKACCHEAADASHERIAAQIGALGRTIGVGPGSRQRRTGA